MLAIGRSVVNGARYGVRFFSDDIPDAVKMMQDGELQVALGFVKPNAPLTDRSTRLAVLSHFTKKHGIPVSSADFPTLRTAEDIANWYASALRPRKLSKHGEGIAKSNGAIEANGEIMSMDHIEAPPNLNLDPKTFRVPKRVGFGGLSSRDKNAIQNRRRERARLEKERKEEEAKKRTIRFEAQ